MPPANDTTAPISVTSSRVRLPNTHAKGKVQETYSTTEGGKTKLAAVDQYVFLLCLISLVLIGNSEQKGEICGAAVGGCFCAPVGERRRDLKAGPAKEDD